MKMKMQTLYSSGIYDPQGWSLRKLLLESRGGRFPAHAVTTVTFFYFYFYENGNFITEFEIFSGQFTESNSY